MTRFSYIPKASLTLLIGLSFLFLRCSEDEPIDEPRIFSPSVSLSEAYEVFDEKGNGIYLKGHLSALSRGDIQDYGFVFLDGNTEESLDVDKHEVVSFGSSSAFSTYSYGDQTTVTFDTILYDVRSPEIEDGFYVKSYLHFNDSTDYSTRRGVIYPKQMKIISVSPKSANVGTEVKIATNRAMRSTTEITALNGLGNSNDPGKSQPYQLYLDDQLVDVSRVSGNDIYFLLPALEGEAKLEVEVNGYRVPSDDYYLSNSNTRYQWEEVTSLERKTTSNYLLFSISKSIYLGGGRANSDAAIQDFWKYNIDIDAWSRVADFPADGDGDGMSFSLSGKGYGGHPNNLYQYDPTTDEWSKVKRPTTSLQYDHKFGTATPIVHKNQVHFTNYEPEVEIGVYYHNFHRFEPINDTYAAQPGFPGSMPSLHTHGGSAYQDKLHFFPQPEHWAYDPRTRKWEQLADIPTTDRYARAFEYDGTLHLLTREKLGVGNYGPITLYVYDEQNDSWEKDVSLRKNPTEAIDFNILTVDQKIYVCIADRDKVYIEKLVKR